MNKNNLLPIDRFAKAVLPMMHFFHNLMLDASKDATFSLPQYRVIMLLSRSGPLSISELKEQLKTAQSTVSEMAERLVQQGLLKREKSPADRRKTLYQLTEKARKQIANHKTTMHERLASVLDAFESQDQEQFIQAFEEIADLIQKLHERTPSTS